MARSHHRKKHKQHLRSYQQERGVSQKSGRTKATGMFTLLGAATGFAIGFFASGSLLWLIIGAVAGGALGYWLGHRIDTQPS